MKRNIFMILTIIVLSLFVIGCNETMVEETIEPVAEETTVPAAIEEPAVVEEIKTEAPVAEETTEPTVEESTTQEFSITAKKWDFAPETITVNKGDLVKITITSTDVQHGFKINAYGINEKFDKGEIKVIEFTADKEGEFPFYCSVPCGSGHSSMGGKLIVK